MRTAIACTALALFTLSACGAADEAEQRDPRCDYQDDREWRVLKASQNDQACWAWTVYDRNCTGEGCLVYCSGINADERQGEYDAAVLDVLSDPFVDIMVECATADGSIDRFSCNESARILISADGCTEDTRMVPTSMFDPEGQTPPASYSAVWQVPAE